jgi:hypothetical protein
MAELEMEPSKFSIVLKSTYPSFGSSPVNRCRNVPGNHCRVPYSARVKAIPTPCCSGNTKQSTNARAKLKKIPHSTPFILHLAPCNLPNHVKLRKPQQQLLNPTNFKTNLSFLICTDTFKVDDFAFPETLVHHDIANRKLAVE